MRSTLSSLWRAGLAGAALFGAAICIEGPARAASINTTDTYAGDVNAIALPEGTFIYLQYFGYQHSDEYITSPGNIFAKLGNSHQIPSNLEVFTGITRFAYFTSFWDHPLVFEVAIPYAWIQDANVGNFPVLNPLTGLGPQPTTSGLINPTIFFDYGVISDPKDERFLVVSSYFFLPIETYNKYSTINVATPNQFTWIPQIEYAEGLQKFFPSLKSWWIDVIALAAIHSDGDAPLAIAGLGQFNTLTQDNTYDIKAFLRYNYMEGGLVAFGIEKSWGGNQIASGGGLAVVFDGPTSLGKDDFLKGHFEAVFPVAKDIHVSTDITHDFEREGGFREDFTAEIRLTKFFLPAQPLK